MLLDIYLISTALSAGISFFSVHVMEKKLERELEREGYKQKKEELSISEKIMEELKIYGILLIPVYNVAFALTAFLKFDEIYAERKEQVLKERNLIEIKKLNENMTKSNGEKLMLDKTDAVINLPLYSVDINNSKDFEEMTKDEKVAYLDLLKKSILEMPEDKSNDDGFQKSLKR